MIVDFPLLMGIGHMGWQEFQADGLADNPRRQIPLGIKDLTVLVGILIDHRPILGQEFVDLPVDVRSLVALEITLSPVLDILLRQVILVGLQELLLHDILDLINLNILVKTTVNLSQDHVHDLVQAHLGYLFIKRKFLVSPTQGRGNFRMIKGDRPAIPL